MLVDWGHHFVHTCNSVVVGGQSYSKTCQGFGKVNDQFMTLQRCLGLSRDGVTPKMVGGNFMENPIVRKFMMTGGYHFLETS